jgi:hypothetical protein
MTGLQIYLFALSSTPLNLYLVIQQQQKNNAGSVGLGEGLGWVRGVGGGGRGGDHAFKNSVFLARTPGAVPSQM